MRVDLIWSVVAVTIATFTVLLAVRHLVALGSEWVFHRYVAVGGLVAFSADALADGGHRIRFEVGGPGIFHNVTLQLLGSPESVVAQPEVRHTMTAGDPALEWTLPATAERAWVMVTWVRPYLQGVESEALARVLSADRLYEWRWYSETYRYLRTVARFAARRGWVPGATSLRELRLYGRWRRTSSNSAADLLGPAATPPPIG
ncbi:hypothetical protein MPRF_53610 [Mycolicibacterium parafortuitum]|uniref:Uncharacterized protein n=1 Tax=Mycolicibacterium parafortuitum TaxID=39692 RepID=A0A7I7UAU8_MYCPF|nr:hypothetical protein MPRF_53610 [Mycolicibacterium parafortuitum]